MKIASVTAFGRSRVRLPLGLIIAAVTVLGASHAYASCGNRPGTPNDEQAKAISSTAIEFSWRNTTNKGMNKSNTVGTGDQPYSIYADIYARNANKQDIGRDETGTGPFTGLVYGSPSSKLYTGLSPNTGYCFAIRARTEGGRQGCVSEKQSNWACTTTLASGAPPVVPPPVRAPGVPHISVSGSGSFIVNGTGFLPNTNVAVRVVGGLNQQTLANALILSIGGRHLASDGNGKFSYTLNGLCQGQGQTVLFFSATDGRDNPKDLATHVLMSNTAQGSCTG